MVGGISDTVLQQPLIRAQWLQANFSKGDHEEKEEKTQEALKIPTKVPGI